MTQLAPFKSFLFLILDASREPSDDIPFCNQLLRVIGHPATNERRGMSSLQHYNTTVIPEPRKELRVSGIPQCFSAAQKKHAVRLCDILVCTRLGDSLSPLRCARNDEKQENAVE